MAFEWYYRRYGREVGPLPAGRLRELAQAGRLRPSDQVRKEGSSRWVAAGSLRGLWPEAEQQESAAGAARHRTDGSGETPPTQPPPATDRPNEGAHGPGPLQGALKWAGRLREQLASRMAARPLAAFAAGVLTGCVLTALLLSPLLVATGSPENRKSSVAPVVADKSSGRAAQITIDRFRAEIFGEEFTKKDFYKKYGEPDRVQEIGHKAFLYYRCKDELAQVVCPQGPFAFQGLIVTTDVNHRY